MGLYQSSRPKAVDGHASLPTNDRRKFRTSSIKSAAQLLELSMPDDPSPWTLRWSTSQPTGRFLVLVLEEVFMIHQLKRDGRPSAPSSSAPVWTNYAEAQGP
jgi:hypothetical protein